MYPYIVLGILVGQAILLSAIVVVAGMASARATWVIARRLVIGLCLVEHLLGLLGIIWLALGAVAGRGSENYDLLMLTLFGFVIIAIQLGLLGIGHTLLTLAGSREKIVVKAISITLIALSGMAMVVGHVAAM